MMFQSYNTYREARAFVARCPWGAHFGATHRDVSTSSIFKPFKDAKLLVSESSLPSPKLGEAVLIAKLKPQVNTIVDGCCCENIIDEIGSYHHYFSLFCLLSQSTEWRDCYHNNLM